ncbi:hypothetical protein CON64_13365 [Bacillus pseudomycoides]|nr:hypothetical protein CON64_13365 [Bacillus pseudomycoides]
MKDFVEFFVKYKQFRGFRQKKVSILYYVGSLKQNNYLSLKTNIFIKMKRKVFMQKLMFLVRK